MNRSHTLVLTALVALITLSHLASAASCNATSPCPASAPCCSEYGFCGTGSYCLGGCEPNYSYMPESCLPNPICQDTQSTFYNLDRVQVNGSLYNGNATAYDWVVNSGEVIATDLGTRLLLRQNNSGTKISSTRYIQYGTIDFVLQTSKWAGVITAAITMSDVKDEIDWEFAGTSAMNSAQTNYWYLGIANYSATEGQSIHVDQDMSTNFHTFTLDWQEEYINWLIDGQVVRTVLKSETYTAEGVPHYPMTPSRIQISIWPGGIESSAPGTIEWAGGMIDWSDPDYVSNGYFWNTIQSVNVACAQNSSQVTGVTGWAYTGNDTNGLPQVRDTNASTVLGGTVRLVPSPSAGAVAVLCVTILTMLGLSLSAL